MKLFCGGLFVCFLVFVAGDTDPASVAAGPIGPATNSPHPNPSTTSSSSSTSPSTPASSTSSSASPTTSKVTTSSSATTTTTTPTTTTATPTTTKTTSTTNTPKPTTSTKSTTTTARSTTASTSTVAPTTPTPVKPIGTWTANYTNTNRTCLVLQAELGIQLPYKDNNTNKSYLIAIPSTAVAVGVCEKNTTEELTLSFNVTNSIKFIFNKTNNKFAINSVFVLLNVTFPGRNDSQVVSVYHNTTEFSTPVTSSYKCLKEQTLNLTQTVGGAFGGLLRISNFQVQAFRNATNTKFDTALDCASSETPDAVPIAVGCALAVLVIIVLAVYLIGRRRSQARGYLSM